MYEVYKPESPLLRKHIVSFNILKKEKDFEKINYFVFPQKGTTIGILMNAGIYFDNFSLKLKKSEKSKIRILLFGKYLMPLYLQYENFIEELSINFTPAGLNYFFSKNSRELAPENMQLLDSASWHDFASSLIPLKSDKERICALESFLLENYVKKDLDKIIEAAAIIDSAELMKLNEIAHRLQLSERSLNRYFNDYLSCSPSVFRKICRFRSAIEKKFINPLNFNLTEIGLESNYYDSPHFTKEFKRLTGQTPRDFFARVVKVGNDNYPYIFS